MSDPHPNPSGRTHSRHARDARAIEHRERGANLPPDGTLTAELDRFGVVPSRARGQNFLIQPAIADRIVAAANLRAGDEAIEIGPGLGMLSERLARLELRRLLLVELDRGLSERLEAAFAGNPATRLTNQDFLDLDLRSVIDRPPVTIVGNLPFNAAAAILRRLCDARALVARMVLMFQREVAERIRARPGTPSGSALSAYTALYWKIESHFRVNAGNFFPRPKVDAEVLVFAPRALPPFAPDREAAVLATIRAVFCAPRKTIRNALAVALGADPAAIAEALERAAIAPGARPATLDIAAFVRLADSLARASLIGDSPSSDIRIGDAPTARRPRAHLRTRDA